ncbi:predicted protein [Naegleria gruberi]|uniref:Predicted protein n=1 Tax=Naegleria gruberi TaxID=5762 RepID=D2VTR8_NAEGR|nr:uncharacterized protein NAEGRDRAFT_72400 [Naegleria gruberi]EFC39702.1 predicted protein [Naegleria gruberi]|eukprot:XP_002672446.1 predicted protein [Naegleria gruberi strain NEG-M]
MSSQIQKNLQEQRPIKAINAAATATSDEEGTVLRFYPQDITVTRNQPLLEMIEKCYVPQVFKDGPQDAEMSIVGGKIKMSQIDKLIPRTPGFDKLHTFTAAKLTANMWRDTVKALRKTFPDDKKLSKAAEYWDKMPNGTLQISPYGLEDEKNAYYSRGGTGSIVLKFGYFTDDKGDTIYTCQSPDIVAHETGHYVLDHLRPEFNDSKNVQTGGLHEAFGDISALSFVFADDAMARALINLTFGNLHASANNFAAHLAEEFGISLGMPGYLRNADDDYKLSQVEEEVHAISEVFTGAYYDALASAFKAATEEFTEYNSVNLLQAVSEYSRNLLLHAIVTVGGKSPDFADIANRLYEIIDLHSKNAPAKVAYLQKLKWKTYFQTEFERREVSKPVNQLRYAAKKRDMVAEQVRPEKEILTMVCGARTLQN